MISKHPFVDIKPPVLASVDGVQKIIDDNPGKYLCIYIADKSSKDWGKSTSRVYMNLASPNLIYIPLNIKKDDNLTILEVLEWAKNSRMVAGINISQPHKSNSAVRNFFKNHEMVDTVLRDMDGNLFPKSLNASAFWDWFLDMNGQITKQILVVGVGGAGLPILLKAMEFKDTKLSAYDVDIAVESNLNGHQLKQVSFIASINKLNLETGSRLLVINAAGKEGWSDNNDLKEMILKLKNNNNIFVDLRPQLSVEVVDYAIAQGWKAFTGNGMNEYNDFELLKGLLNYFKEKPISFKEFVKLVKSAS